MGAEKFIASQFTLPLADNGNAARQGLVLWLLPPPLPLAVELENHLPMTYVAGFDCSNRNSEPEFGKGALH